MDTRLGLFNHRRVSPILQDNVLEVARALTLALEGQAEIRSVFWHSQALIHIYGQTVDTLIMGKDWEKIAPYIFNGYFQWRVMTPFGCNTINDTSKIDIKYSLTYNRVKDTLAALFTTKAPTPNL